MTSFDISFEFESICYSAKVLRTGSRPVQYHVYDIEPKIYNFPNTIIFCWELNQKKLQWYIEPNKYPILINYEIAGSIFKKLEKLGIPIGDNY